MGYIGLCNLEVTEGTNPISEQSPNMQSKIIVAVATILVALMPAIPKTAPDGIVSVEPVELSEEIQAENFEAEKPLSPVVEKKVPAPAPPQVVTYSGNWVEDCKRWASEAGVTLNSWAIELIGRESSCNPTVWNHGGSGACGIPQALPCSKLPQGINTSPPQQILWMYNYVLARYGSWQNAVYFHDSHNWY